MRIQFIKSCVFNRRLRVIGNITTVTEKVANELFLMGVAKEYTGEYPPRVKTKTDLFKPKDLEENGKEYGEDWGERSTGISGGGTDNMHDGGNADDQ